MALFIDWLQHKKYKKQNKDLQSKVALGAVLQAGNVTVSAIRIRNSGTQSETTRAAKTNMIKACFTLLENKLSKAGDKNIYIKILPDTETIYTRKQMNDIFKKFMKNIVGRLNKFLDPPQIKQCSNDWI